MESGVSVGVVVICCELGTWEGEELCRCLIGLVEVVWRKEGSKVKTKLE